MPEQYDLLIRGMKFVLRKGAKIAVIGWLDEFHDEFTRLAERTHKVRFFAPGSFRKISTSYQIILRVQRTSQADLGLVFGDLRLRESAFTSDQIKGLLRLAIEVETEKVPLSPERVAFLIQVIKGLDEFLAMSESEDREIARRGEKGLAAVGLAWRELREHGYEV